MDVDDDRCADLEAKLREAQALLHETETKSDEDEERANQVEGQLKEAQMLAEEADRKYDEVARKLAMVEADLERAEERAEAGENKIVELEEELRVVGNNLKSLELSEEKALEREETFEEQIRQLDTRLKEVSEPSVPLLLLSYPREMERELRAVGINLKTLEVNEERALERENSFTSHVAHLEQRVKEVLTPPPKIVELEEELRVVGNNLKSLEVSEEKALQREDSYEEQIRTLAARLKEAETRAEFAERSVQKLQKEVDRLEDDLLLEKEKVRNLTEEIEQTVQEIQGS
ncbi:hypothetical protein QR680_009531 [Steinernema hermaphroditum]|uniref:Tropomyosin n=1 Tax=Steinernema hermaphroditum TaxID=289476 RepID=A0AA39IMP5_9BILA|nr:hypothetical protein QR680_009531 [Steinernema hermaphroditum]